MFVPEGLVVHVEQYIEQKKKEEETKYEKHIADKYGISVEDYRTQQEMLDKANQRRDKEHDNNVPVLPDPPLETEEQDIAGDLEETIKLVSTGRPVSYDRLEKRRKALEEFEGQKREHSYFEEQRKALEEFEEQKREQKYFDEQRKALERIAEQNKKETSQSSEDSYHVVEGGLGEREVKYSFLELYTKNSSQSTGNGASVRSGHHQEPLYQNILRNGVRHDSPVLGRKTSNQSPMTRQRSTPVDAHGYSSLSSISQQHYSSNVPPPINEHHFTIGSMVVIPTQSGEPLRGVIMWIGTVPGKPGLIAGVELVSLK